MRTRTWARASARASFTIRTRELTYRRSRAVVISFDEGSNAKRRGRRTGRAGEGSSARWRARAFSRRHETALATRHKMRCEWPPSRKGGARLDADRHRTRMLVHAAMKVRLQEIRVAGIGIMTRRVDGDGLRGRRRA